MRRPHAHDKSPFEIIYYKASLDGLLAYYYMPAPLAVAITIMPADAISRVKPARLLLSIDYGLDDRGLFGNCVLHASARNADIKAMRQRAASSGVSCRRERECRRSNMALFSAIMGNRSPHDDLRSCAFGQMLYHFAVIGFRI